MSSSTEFLPKDAEADSQEEQSSQSEASDQEDIHDDDAEPKRSSPTKSNESSASGEEDNSNNEDSDDQAEGASDSESRPTEGGKAPRRTAQNVPNKRGHRDHSPTTTRVSPRLAEKDSAEKRGRSRSPQRAVTPQRTKNGRFASSTKPVASQPMKNSKRSGSPANKNSRKASSASQSPPRRQLATANLASNRRSLFNRTPTEEQQKYALDFETFQLLKEILVMVPVPAIGLNPFVVLPSKPGWVFLHVPTFLCIAQSLYPLVLNGIKARFPGHDLEDSALLSLSDLSKQNLETVTTWVQGLMCTMENPGKETVKQPYFGARDNEKEKLLTFRNLDIAKKQLTHFNSKLLKDKNMNRFGLDTFIPFTDVSFAATRSLTKVGLECGRYVYLDEVHRSLVRGDVEQAAATFLELIDGPATEIEKGTKTHEWYFARPKVIQEDDQNTYICHPMHESVVKHLEPIFTNDVEGPELDLVVACMSNVHVLKPELARVSRVEKQIKKKHTKSNGESKRQERSKSPPRGRQQASSSHKRRRSPSRDQSPSPSRSRSRSPVAPSKKRSRSQSGRSKSKTREDGPACGKCFTCRVNKECPLRYKGSAKDTSHPDRARWCSHCLDKKQYGGKGTIRQTCIYLKCAETHNSRYKNAISAQKRKIDKLGGERKMANSDSEESEHSELSEEDSAPAPEKKKARRHSSSSSSGSSSSSSRRTSQTSH